MKRAGSFATALTAATLAIMPAASPVAAKDSRILDAVAMTGSGSLALKALSDPRLPAPLKQARAKIAHDMGLTGQPGEVTSRWLRFAPVLAHDSNINGGSSGDSVTVSGLTFEVDEKFRAASGLLLGLSFNAGMRINAAPLTALELDMGGMAAFAPEHDMTKTRLTGSACLRRDVGKGTHLRGCADAYLSTYELGRTSRLGAEVSVSRAFASSNAFHEVTLGLKQNLYLEGEDYQQTVLSAQYVTARPGPMAFTAGIQLGSDTGDRISMRERVSVGLATELAGKQTTFALSAQNNRGGLFLGEERRERTYGVSVSRRFTDKLTVGVSYTRTKAQHEFFDDNALGLDIGWRF